ncbi:hypothetical protein AVEN_171065-1 [Araneus ventricosus]|uniref:Uncharacterized protein n=1 Tax=Araneus ventricosus TaxID=182803 RepID=A0A4Y2MXI3_ARAVE|nr:hypothetical protein AVEN_171065-1 [Araneus ventricosus]
MNHIQCESTSSRKIWKRDEWHKDDSESHSIAGKMPFSLSRAKRNKEKARNVTAACEYNKAFYFCLVWLRLVILTSRFIATRELFWDGPRNFEPWSADEDDTRADIPLSTLPHHISGRTFGHDV